MSKSINYRLEPSQAGDFSKTDGVAGWRKNNSFSYEQQLKNEIALSKRRELQLQEAVHAAREADKIKTVFLCNIAHELRTPLNAIIGFSDVIRSELFGPAGNAKYPDYANDIHQAGTHLLRLINDLLDVSRLEAGEFSMAEEEICLEECITGSLHMLEEQALKKRITLSRDIPSDLPFMLGDRTRIKQILVNLVCNAIKFTPPEGLVHVSAARLPAGGIRITVADTGIGITPENLSLVFETFKQISNPLTGPQEGAGLGLPLAKKLTERHGGILEISSAQGRGTKACVTFPASRILKVDGAVNA